MGKKFQRILGLVNILLSLCLLLLIYIYSGSNGPIQFVDEQFMSASEISVRKNPDNTWLINFPQNMVRQDQVRQSLDESPIRITPHYAHECVWTSSNQLAVHFPTALKNAHEYILSMKKQLHSQHGVPVAEDFSCLLTGTRPCLEHSSAHLDGDVMQVLLHFNMDIDLNGLSDLIELSNPQGVATAYTIAVIDKQSIALHIQEKYISPCTHIVHIAKGLRSTQGSLKSEKDLRHEITFGTPMIVGGHHIYDDRLSIRLNQHIDRIEDGFLSISPAVQWNCQPSWRGIACHAAFSAGTRYTVTLAQGFPGYGKQRLAQETRIQFTAPLKDPEIEFADSGEMLSAQALPQLKLTSINCNHCDVRIRPIYIDSYLFLSQNNQRLPSNMYGPAINFTVPIASNRNISQTLNTQISSTLDLSAHMDGLPAIFEIAIKDSDSYWFQHKKIIHLSDIGINARIAYNNAWVSCHSIADGTPLNNCAVHIFNQHNMRIASGHCNHDGIALLDWVDEKSTATTQGQYIITAKYKDDNNAIDSMSHRSAISSHSQSGRAYTAAKNPYLPYDAYLHCDRGLIRPGGEIHATCILRDYQRRALHNISLEARLYDPLRKQQYAIPVTVNSAGLALITHTIERHQRTGSWSLELYDREHKRSIARTQFIVESFIPERLHAKIIEQPNGWTLNKKNICEVDTHWLEGGAAAGHGGTLYCRYNDSPLRIDAYSAYSFGALKRFQPGAMTPLHASSDHKGRSHFRIPQLDIPNTCQKLVAKITVEIDDPSGRAVRSIATIPMTRSDAFLGVHADKHSCEIILLDSNHQALTKNQKLSLAIDRVEWTYHPRSDGKYGTWKRIYIPVHNQEITCVAGHAQVDLSGLSFKKYSAHRLRVECIGQFKLASECAIGSGYWKKPGYLKVTAQEIADINDPLNDLENNQGNNILTATHAIEIDSPHPGPACLSIEGSRIYSAQRITLHQGINTIRIAIDPDIHDPNVHCIISQHSAQRDSTHNNRSLNGSCSIKLHTQQLLSVNIESPTTIRPNNMLDVRIHAGTAEYVCLSLVDYGILNITRHPQADPFAYFRQRRRLDSIGLSAFHKLIQNASYNKHSLPGGDGALSKDISSSNYIDTTLDPDVQIIALSSTIIAVDSDGYANYQFPIANYEGKLRLTAIAVNKNQCAASSQDISVSDPIGLRIAVPTRLTPGDSCQIPITLCNRIVSLQTTDTANTIGITDVGSTHATQNIRCQYRIYENDILQYSNSISHNLKYLERVTFSIPVRCGRESYGTIRIECTAEARNGTDTATTKTTVLAQRKQTAQIAIHRSQRFAQEHKAFVSTGQQTISIGTDWHKLKTLSLRLHSNPLMHLQNALEDLVRYPHGCIEQTTSRCFSVLAYKNSLPYIDTENNKSAIEENRVNMLINHGIERLHSMIVAKNGFAWWPQGHNPAPYGSLYASEFLVSAKESGYHISKQLYDHALTYAQYTLEHSRDIHLRCYAVYILCRAEKGVNHWLETLRPQAKSREDFLYLAISYARIGNKERAQNILRSDNYTQNTSNAYLHFSSQQRRTALELQLRLALHPQDTATHALATSLRQALITHWKKMHTNARAYAIIGLCAYMNYHHHTNNENAENIVTITSATGTCTYTCDPHKELRIDLNDSLYHKEFTLLSNRPIYGILEISGYRSPIRKNTTNPFIHIQRRVLNIQTGDQAKTFKQGNSYRVELQIHSKEIIKHLAICDILPAGFEAIPQRIQKHIHTQKQTPRKFKHIYTDIRDDRVNTFISENYRGSYTCSYLIRACFKGTYRSYGLHAEAMYNPLQHTDIYDADTITIE